MDNTTTWQFPKDIDFDTVPQYIQELEQLNPDKTIIFDLNKTEKIHSSFIGFLIHVKEQVKNAGGSLILKPSPALQKTFDMMNVSDYFANPIEFNTLYKEHYTKLH